jgi:hypothetical protein
MKYLVSCTCGHSLERHGLRGCAGDGSRACTCERDPGRALEAAIDDVRSRPWATPEAVSSAGDA